MSAFSPDAFVKKAESLGWYWSAAHSAFVNPEVRRANGEMKRASNAKLACAISAVQAQIQRNWEAAKGSALAKVLQS